MKLISNSLKVKSILILATVLGSSQVLAFGSYSGQEVQCGSGFERRLDPYGRPTCVRVEFDAVSCQQNFHSTFTMMMADPDLMESELNEFIRETRMESRISESHALSYARVTGDSVEQARRKISRACYRNALSAASLLSEGYRKACYEHIQRWFRGYFNHMDACPRYDEIF